MRNLLVVALNLSVLGLVVGLAVGQDEGKPSKKASPKDYENIARKGSYTGKLSGVGPKTVSFRVDDADYQAKLKWARERPTPAAQKVEIAKVEAAFASVKAVLGREFEFEFAEKVELRKADLPFEFGDNGRPKTYTAAQLTKLKGNPGLPGFVAQTEDFTPGATAVATFGKVVNGKPTVVRLILDNRDKK